jgi:hypothetical protein
LVRQPENLIKRLFSWAMFGLSALTARIVNNQKWIALLSFRDLANWKSNRAQHICKITGELGH